MKEEELRAVDDMGGGSDLLTNEKTNQDGGKILWAGQTGTAGRLYGRNRESGFAEKEEARSLVRVSRG